MVAFYVFFYKLTGIIKIKLNHFIFLLKCIFIFDLTFYNLIGNNLNYLLCYTELYK